eukprot:7922599-Pyramimonas_sp.AAC.1
MAGAPARSDGCEPDSSDGDAMPAAEEELQSALRPQVTRATLVTFLRGSNASLDNVKALSLPWYYAAVHRAARLGDV